MNTEQCMPMPMPLPMFVVRVNYVVQTQRVLVRAWLFYRPGRGLYVTESRVKRNRKWRFRGLKIPFSPRRGPTMVGRASHRLATLGGSQQRFQAVSGHPGPPGSDSQLEANVH